MAKSFLNTNYSRGIRNNNPGNLIFVQSNNWQGRISYEKNTDANKHFEQFENVAYGLRALFILMQKKINSGKNTLVTFISSYAPSFENNTQAYINKVASDIGVTLNQKLGTLTKTLMIAFAKSIVSMENGADAKYITDADYEEAYNLYKGITPTNKTNSNIIPIVLTLIGIGAIGIYFYKKNY